MPDLPDLQARIRVDTSDLDAAVGRAAKAGAAIGSAIGTAGGQAISAAGSSIVGAFGSALEAGKDSSRLAAQLGLSPAEQAAAAKTAGTIYSKNYGDSLAQVNDAVSAVSRNIGTQLNSPDLQGITSKVLNLSSAFDADLGGATRAVGALLKNGLAPNAQAALDIVTRGFQTGVDKSEDYLDTLNEYSPLFSRLGISGAAATGLLSQGLKGGARDADTVADALKEFQIRATDGSTASAAGFQLLGLNAKDSTAQIAAGGKGASEGLQQVLDRLRGIEDPVKRNAAAVALFGTKAEDLGASLFALDPSKAVQSLGQVTGAADRMDTTLSKNAAASIETVKRGLQVGLVGAVNTVLPGLTGVANVAQANLAPGFALVGSALDRVVPALRGFISAIPQPVLVALGAALTVVATAIAAQTAATLIASAVTGTWGAVTGLFAVAKNAETGALERGTLARLAHNISTGAGAVISGVAAVATTALSVATTALGVAVRFATGPVGLIIIGLGLLVAAVVLAYRHSETFRDIVQGAFRIVLAVGETVKTFFLTTLPNAFGTFIGVVTSVFGRVRTAVSDALTAVVTFLTAAPGRFITALGDLGGRIYGFAKAAWDRFDAAVDAAVVVIKATVTALPGQLVTALGNLGQRIYDFAKAAWTRFDNAVDAAVAVVTGTVRAIPGSLVGALGDLGGRIYGFAKAAWDRFDSAVDAAVAGIVGTVRGIPGKLLGALGNVGSALYDAGQRLIDGLGRGVGDAIGAVVQKVKDGLGLIGRLLPGSPIKDGPLKGWNNGGAGKRLMGMLQQGIAAGTPGVQGAMAAALGGIGLPGAGGGSTAGVAGAGGGSSTTYNLTLNGVTNPGQADGLMTALRRMELLTP